MVTVKIEDRVKKLEEITSQQQNQITHLHDILEIQNVMSRYVYYQAAGKLEEMIGIYAHKTPGVTAEVANYGVFDGVEGARRMNSREPERAAKPGWLVLHTLTTPIIEVAKDGKTAKGVWISPGNETGQSPNGEFEAFWTWTKYGCDFVKEDGQWKIWHYHVYGIFRTPFDKCWTEEFEFKITRPVIDLAAPKADKPCTYDNRYNKKYVTSLVPEPPAPFETFDPKKAY